MSELLFIQYLASFYKLEEHAVNLHSSLPSDTICFMDIFLEQ